MKVIFIMLGILPIFSYSQTLTPAANTFKVSKTETIAEIKERVNSSISVESKIREIDSIKSLNQTARSTARQIDSIRRAIEDSVYLDSLPFIVAQLNTDSRVKPMLTAGLSNLENSKQSYGNLSIGLLFRLTRYKIDKKNRIDPHFVYMFFSAKTATFPDSSSIQKTFMFPELNKRDLVLGYYFERIKNNFSMAPTFEFSLNRFSDTSLKKTFVSQSFLAGVKLQWNFPVGNVNSYFSIFPYYSLITVEKKYSDAYNEITKETRIPYSFNSIGLQVTAQASRVILFCNMKYIINNRNDISSPDLKTFVYTIGTNLAL